MESLGSFYADPHRSGSREIRFGSGWRSRNYESFEFNVFWVEATKELCALRSPIRHVRSDGVISRFVLGLPPHAEVQELKDNELSIEVLGRLDEEQLRVVLARWERHLHDPDGFDWIRTALAPPRT